MGATLQVVCHCRGPPIGGFVSPNGRSRPGRFRALDSTRLDLFRRLGFASPNARRLGVKARRAVLVVDFTAISHISSFRQNGPG